jgi:uncharacterized membrane protein
MPSFSHRFYKLALGGLLVIASLVCAVLYIAHARLSGSERYSFLPINLFLAWIPLGAAAMAYLTRRQRRLFFWVMPLCLVVWLMFFPNAPYLLTDFQHLAYSDGGAPLWFDVIILVWFAWTGLMLGIASLYLVQEMVTERFNTWIGWIFTIGVTILSSLGVFLGRFLRWNSWDLLRDPIPIAWDLYAIARHPISNLPTYVFTILFTLLFLFIYVTFHLFGRIGRNPSKD